MVLNRTNMLKRFKLEDIMVTDHQTG
uniref:Uncharacterized protein n=1 Tax=Arundo donax TaxID=35708 RepID=A0A0A9HC89_ARUDO